MTENNFNSISDLKPCLLYISKSSSVLEDRINSIKSFLKGKINLDMDYRIFSFEEGQEENEFINFFSTPSFFSEKKVAVIKNLEKTPKNIKEFIESNLALNQTNGYSTILIITATKVNEKSKLFSRIKETGMVKILYVPQTDSIKRWLKEKSEFDGIKFTAKAASKIIENVNYDLKLLKSEYEKIYTYTGGSRGSEVDEIVVEKLVSRIFDVKIFDFIDFIGNRDKSSAFKALKAISYEKESGLRIISLLHVMFKSFLYFKIADDPDGGNAGPIDLMKTYLKRNNKNPENVDKFIAKKYAGFSKNYSIAEIIRIIDILAGYDVLFRISETREVFLFTRMINEITGG